MPLKAGTKKPLSVLRMRLKKKPTSPVKEKQLYKVIPWKKFVPPTPSDIQKLYDEVAQILEPFHTAIPELRTSGDGASMKDLIGVLDALPIKDGWATLRRYRGRSFGFISSSKYPKVSKIICLYFKTPTGDLQSGASMAMLMQNGRFIAKYGFSAFRKAIISDGKKIAKKTLTVG